MAKFNLDFNKSLKKVLIIFGAIFVAGIIVAAVFGVNMSIDFKGGTRIAYSYEGDVKKSDFEASIKEVLSDSHTVDQSESFAGDVKTFSISLVGAKSISAETQEAITKKLAGDFKDNKFEIYNSTSVSPNIAGTFFLKSLVAVVLTAIFVVIYVAIRFRRIGGVSAAVTALITLVMDVLITFFICVFFRLEIDANYIAVVLTILGYSLNDTIVLYDRVREKQKLYPELKTPELVNKSINEVMIRNIVTTVTTVAAVLTIVVVAEIFGLTSLRTFAIPMAFGLVSGGITSMFIAGPLWVIWKGRKQKKLAK